MSSGDNTLFLRLAAPMQAWGTSSRFQLRRTDAYPSKSGVLGLLLCAKGIQREDSARELATLSMLRMGVRVDRCGRMDWDYHTAGAKIGIRSAEGKIKKTATTGEYETLLSRRQYLIDASFLVVLQGDADIIADCANALNEPVWPVFLGRKCCIPTEPVFMGTGKFDTLHEALESILWQPRISTIDSNEGETRALDIYIEHLPGTPPPSGARLVYDVPRGFGFYNYGARWVIASQMTVAVGNVTQIPVSHVAPYKNPYGSAFQKARKERLEKDHELCVFCKSPAEDVHHLNYDDVRVDTLRSLCKLCHDACTMLEYGNEMHIQRIDPADPANRFLMVEQINRLISERRLGQRRKILESTRNWVKDYKDSSAEEDY